MTLVRKGARGEEADEAAPPAVGPARLPRRQGADGRGGDDHDSPPLRRWFLHGLFA
ncbi:MAG: hypothetical protein IRY94_15210 [Rhodospirillaceae bacterium]|nr:hypothetical protein [Rhodospirillaceae bacterium]